MRQNVGPCAFCKQPGQLVRHTQQPRYLCTRCAKALRDTDAILTQPLKPAKDKPR